MIKVTLLNVFSFVFISCFVGALSLSHLEGTLISSELIFRYFGISLMASLNIAGIVRGTNISLGIALIASAASLWWL